MTINEAANPKSTTLLLARRFLLRHGHPSGTFPSAGVCMRALTTNRQCATMSEPAIAANVHQSLDVHLDALAEVAFNLALRFEDRSDATQLVLVQVLNPSINVHRGLVQNRTCARTADTVDVCQPNLGPFIWWKIDACYTCHFL